MTEPQPGARIIVGLDRNGSHNDTVLAAALGQARLTKAAVSVVHAIADTATTAASLDTAASHDRRAARQARHDAATEDLHCLLAKAPRDGDAPVTVDYDVPHGDPATVLLSAAQHANLIVMDEPGGAVLWRSDGVHQREELCLDARTGQCDH